jgi:hypothetical protein
MAQYLTFAAEFGGAVCAVSVGILGIREGGGPEQLLALKPQFSLPAFLKDSPQHHPAQQTKFRFAADNLLTPRGPRTLSM